MFCDDIILGFYRYFYCFFKNPFVKFTFQLVMDYGRTGRNSTDIAVVNGSYGRIVGNIYLGIRCIKRCNFRINRSVFGFYKGDGFGQVDGIDLCLLPVPRQRLQ